MGKLENIQNMTFNSFEIAIVVASLYNVNLCDENFSDSV
jgi:hypothetical protein